MNRKCLLFALIVGIGGLGPSGLSAVVAAGEPDQATVISAAIPSLRTDNHIINEAFRIAIGDLMGNVQPFKDGLLERPVPVILAGLHYDTPWTRDAAINAWNGGSLILPEVARNTLLSVLTRADGRVRIGGQYWDAIVWTTGAWHHYLYTGDRQFLATALEATKNSLAYFEPTEFDATTNLFRGPGWSDGVAGYPDEYADAGGSSSILDWPKHNPSKVSKPGYGIPMQTLSTNCLYYNAYLTAEKMASELQVPADPQWTTKAAKLKQAINAQLWLPDMGYYRFLIGLFASIGERARVSRPFSTLCRSCCSASARSAHNSGVLPSGPDAAVDFFLAIVMHSLPPLLLANDHVQSAAAQDVDRGSWQGPPLDCNIFLERRPAAAEPGQEWDGLVLRGSIVVRHRFERGGQKN